MRGIFLTIEGVDGSGKSTQVDLLAEWLAGCGYPVLRTQEPGGTRIGERIRSILLNPDHREMAERTELLLYAAARAQHVREVIEPALTAGRIIICSRFADSTLAYQGYGSGIDLALIDRLNQVATNGLRPDLTLLFDLDPQQGISRVLQRVETANGDRIEQRQLDFHTAVRAGFLRLAQAEPERIRVIRADRPVDAVHRDVAAIVGTYLRTRLDLDCSKGGHEDEISDRRYSG